MQWCTSLYGERRYKKDSCLGETSARIHPMVGVLRLGITWVYPLCEHNLGLKRLWGSWAFDKMAAHGPGCGHKGWHIPFWFFFFFSLQGGNAVIQRLDFLHGVPQAWSMVSNNFHYELLNNNWCNGAPRGSSSCSTPKVFSLPTSKGCLQQRELWVGRTSSKERKALVKCEPSRWFC